MSGAGRDDLDTLFSPGPLREALSELGVFGVDIAGGRAFASSLWKLSGYESSDIFDQGLAQVVHPEDRHVLDRIADLNNGRTDAFEDVFRLKKADGTWLWVAARYQVADRNPDGSPRLLFGLDQDVTAIKRSEEELRRRLDEIDSLRQVVTDVSASLDLETTVDLILRHTRRLIPYQKATVQLLEEGWLKVTGSTGFADSAAAEALRFPYPEEGSLSTLALQTRLPVICNDVPARFPHFRHVEGEAKVLSWLGIPLVAGGQPVGLLALDSVEHDYFQSGHLAIAEILAAQLAQAVDQARLYGQVRTMALTDHLTGAGSRHALQVQAPYLLERARRDSRPLAALMIDLDHFKTVNDRFGHETGDRVLRRAADVIRSCLRAADLPFRYGGEEFLVLLPETGAEAARAVAERIRQAAGAPPADPTVPPVTLSVGLGSLAPRGSLTELIADADAALYRAKQAGRNRVEA